MQDRFACAPSIYGAVGGELSQGLSGDFRGEFHNGKVGGLDGVWGQT